MDADKSILSPSMNILLNQIIVRLPGSKKILFKVGHLAVVSGSHILIQGESGKGKTTLLHLIAGLMNPQEGSVLLDHTDLRTLTEQDLSQLRREKIGLIFQKLNLIDHLTAIENILLCSKQPTKTEPTKTEAQAMAILEKVGLKEKKNVLTASLSLGEQQRVAIARVLMKNPQIILADEPTSSLDETNAGKVMELLISAAQGKTLLVVSHDHRIARFFPKITSFENLVS